MFCVENNTECPQNRNHHLKTQKLHLYPLISYPPEIRYLASNFGSLNNSFIVTFFMYL